MKVSYIQLAIGMNYPHTVKGTSEETTKAMGDLLKLLGIEVVCIAGHGIFETGDKVIVSPETDYDDLDYSGVVTGFRDMQVLVTGDHEEGENGYFIDQLKKVQENVLTPE